MQSITKVNLKEVSEFAALKIVYFGNTINGQIIIIFFIRDITKSKVVKRKVDTL